jgi:hypothetical protein
MQAMARALDLNGFKQVGLWVLEANHPAHKFYDRLGGRKGSNVQHEFGGRLVPEVAYLWTSPTELEAAATEVLGRE